MQAKPHSALVIVGHGSTLNPDSSAPTLDHAETIRRSGVFREVVCAFWKEEPSLREVLRMVDSPEVYVVPNFISEGYFTQQVIPRELGLTGRTTEFPGQTVHYCDPVGLHPTMTKLLLARAAEVAPGVPPAESSLVIVGHGTGMNDNSTKAIKDQVALIQSMNLGFAEVLDSYMEEAPLLAEWDKLTTAPNVIVVPFFIADGLHSFQDIPVLLGIEPEPTAAASQMEVFKHNPHDLRGRKLYYSSAIGTETMLADVILDQVEAFDLAGTTKTNGTGSKEVSDTLEIRLAAWLEHGGGRIGEVEIALTNGGWLITHYADAAQAGVGMLERHEQAAEAREISRYDAQGIFRPLKSAPTLRRGWEIYLTTLTQVLEALDFLYPAAVANLVRYEAGSIQQQTLKQMLGRQTGMYRVTGLLRENEAKVLVAETCQDGKCLRKIMWPYDDGKFWDFFPAEKTHCPPLAANRNAYWPILCTDACPILVGAAREMVKDRMKAEAPAPTSTPVPVATLS